MGKDRRLRGGGEFSVSVFFVLSPNNIKARRASLLLAKMKLKNERKRKKREREKGEIAIMCNNTERQSNVQQP